MELVWNVIEYPAPTSTITNNILLYTSTSPNSILNYNNTNAERNLTDHSISASTCGLAKALSSSQSVVFERRGGRHHNVDSGAQEIDARLQAHADRPPCWCERESYSRQCHDLVGRTLPCIHSAHDHGQTLGQPSRFYLGRIAADSTACTGTQSSSGRRTRLSKTAHSDSSCTSKNSTQTNRRASSLLARCSIRMFIILESCAWIFCRIGGVLRMMSRRF